MGLLYLLTLYGFIRADCRGGIAVRAPVRGDSLTSRLRLRMRRGSATPPYNNPLSGGSNRWLGVSGGACLCGMATKQVMVTAPVLVLL